MRYFDSFFFAVTLAVLNGLDALLTLLLNSGEANPLLDLILALGVAIGLGALPFLLFKLVVVNSLIYVCHKHGAFVTHPGLTLAVVLVYTAVVAFSAGLLC